MKFACPKCAAKYRIPDEKLEGRGALNQFKARFARPAHERALTLTEALRGADVFLRRVTKLLTGGWSLRTRQASWNRPTWRG